MDGYTVRETRDRHEVAAAADDTPASIVILGALGEPLLDGRRRSWIVERRGAVAAVVLAAELAPGSWTASLLCVDPDAASTVADLLVRGPARRLSGVASHLDPVRPWLPDLGSLRMTLTVHTPSADLADPDPRVRLARPGDLAALDALYRRFELEFLPDGYRAQVLEALIARRRVVLAEVDGEVVAAERCELRTGRWDWWSGLTVLPAHRGKGLSSAIGVECERLSRAVGHRMAGAVAPTNPVPYPSEARSPDEWIEQALPAPVPGPVVRGGRKLRRRARRVAARWRP